jgi:FAD/FMN-containing dehydrogenase
MAQVQVRPEEGVRALGPRFSGALLIAGDDGYDEARKIHNGLIDKRPAVIARCLGTADVVDALAFAKERGLEVSVRGGGHNVAGRAVTEGGLMIDLSLMKGIHVDRATRTARAEGGVTWREFNRATALHGLATTGGVISTTGIAGLTLGGGYGWLMAKHGLAVDNLVSAEIVTAKGEVLTASANENADLFWAIRGGGGNFGIATSFEFRLHPLRDVFGGVVAHPFPAAKAALRFYRDFARSLGDDFTVVAGLTHAPDGSGTPLAAFIVCHYGSPDRAQADLRPLLEFGSPAITQVGPMPYPALNMILDGGFPSGALNYWKSSFLRDLEDGAIDVMVDRFAVCRSPMSGMVIEPYHGAVTRVSVSSTAVPHRERGYNVLIISEWLDPTTSDRNITWARDTYGALTPYLAARRYVNYLDADERADAVRAAYGSNYTRLAELKRKYDPENIFHLNQNIEPA